MKKALRKDFFREIRKNSGRFISIFFIVALGAAFFAGIRSAEYDMEYSADKYYDDVDLMDLRVISTLGLEEEDLEDIRNVDGVSAVNGGYTKEALCHTEDAELVVNLIAYTDQVNRPTVEEGRLPKAADECFADSAFLQKSGYCIGDMVTYASGTDDPLTDSLVQDTYTIVGSGDLPYYMDIGRGNGTIGDGSIDAFILLSPEVFDMDVYTEAYVQIDGAKNEFSYSDAYTDRVQRIEDELEAIQEEACLRRYNGIQDEAQEKLQEAKDEVADAEKKLADAEQELTDGWTKVNDAQQTIWEKETELVNAQQEVDDGEAKLQEAKEEIRWAEYQLAQAKTQIEEQEGQLWETKQQLGMQQDMVNAQYQQYETQAGQVSQSRSQIEEAKGQLAQVEEQLNMVAQQLAYYGMTTSPEYEQLLYAQSQLSGQIAANEPIVAAGEQQLAQGKAVLDEAQEQLTAAWEQVGSGEAQIAQAWAEFARQREALNNGYPELEAQEQAWKDGKAQVEEGWNALDEGIAELAKNRAELEEAQAEYDKESEEARLEIADAKKEIEENEADLADIEMPEWYILDRDKISSYVSFSMDAERMGSIGEVFPVMFFLVAALVSLTAMTRMIEEQRTAIGTLKALGYSDITIAMKYFSYAMLATVGGSVLGVAFGSVFLPWVIIQAYGTLYTGLPKYYTPLNIDQAALAILASAACTGLATLAASYRELRAKPAQLMRPEAPRAGKRVLLERVSILWRHLNFTQKSTIRNLARYKKRFFMTVIGIGGCMSLMLVGFGLQDSITVVVKNQYTHIFTYDVSVSMDSNVGTEDKNAFLELCRNEENVSGIMQVYNKTVDLSHGDNTREAAMEVPQNVEQIKDFLVLRNRSNGEHYEFPEDGIIITEKTANMLDASVGDTITITVGDMDTVEAPIAVITENYVMHYIYMAPQVYHELFGEEPDYNQLWMNMSSDEVLVEQELGRRLLGENACSGVTFISERVEDIDYMLQTLNSVMYVLISSAGLLAFVVLYNLNSINITERKRELATLKVLGFYDKEVAAYVYRENMILTLIGIAFGIIMGTFLHQFVIRTVEVDAMMFGRVIGLFSFVISGVLSFVFSLVVNGMMYYRLRKIDMIESLKSVE